MRNIIHQDWFIVAALWTAPVVFLSIFYFYPLGSILITSFSRGEGSLVSPFYEMLSSPSIQNIFCFTVWQATLSTILTLIVGLPGAYLIARYNFRGKSLLLALTSIPFVLPTLVVASAFSALLGPRGWINLALMGLFDLSHPPIQFVNTFWAILVAHVFYNTTIILRSVGDFWSHLDPRQGQAGQVLGANRLQTLFHITLPLLMPAILAAAMLVFIFDFTSFGVILVLGGPRYATLEVEIYYQTISLFNLPLAAALSVLQLVCTLGFMVFYTRLSAKVSRPFTLRPRRYTQSRLISWKSRTFAALYITFLIAFLVTPLIALAARSFTRLEPNRGQLTPVQTGFTLDYYKELTGNRRQSLFYAPPSTAIAVSLTYALITIILSLSLGFPASLALARERGKGINRVFDPLIMLPLGTSAITLGLGFIIALSHPPLDLRKSVLLIPLAHTLVAFPFVVRSLTPALLSIKPRLRQAASVMGASPVQVLRHIDLPLTGRALLVAAAFAFTISLGEFGATALIYRPEYPTLPVMIYRYLSQPGGLNYGQALALSTILMVITGAGMLAIERFRIADIGEF